MDNQKGYSCSCSFNLLKFCWTLIYHGLVFFGLMTVAAFGARVISFMSYDVIRIPGLSSYYFDAIVTLMTFVILTLYLMDMEQERKYINQEEQEKIGSHRVIGFVISAAYCVGIVTISNFSERLSIPSESMRQMSSPIDSILKVLLDFSSRFDSEGLSNKETKLVDLTSQVQVTFIAGILFPIYWLVRSTFFHLKDARENELEQHQTFEQFLISIITSCQRNTWRVKQLFMYFVAFLYEILESVCLVVVPLIIGFVYFYDRIVMESLLEQQFYNVVTITFGIFMALLLPMLEDLLMPTSWMNFLTRNTQCRFVGAYCLLYCAFLPPLIIFYNLSGQFSTSDSFWLNQPNIQLMIAINSMSYCCFGLCKIVMINLQICRRGKFIYSALAIDYNENDTHVYEI